MYRPPIDRDPHETRGADRKVVSGNPKAPKNQSMKIPKKQRNVSSKNTLPPPPKAPKVFNPLKVLVGDVVPIAIDKFNESNYSYLIKTSNTSCILVDPSDPSLVLKKAESLNLTPSHILVTHNHQDHAGGSLEIIQHCLGCEVISSKIDNVKGMTKSMTHMEELTVGSVTVRAMLTQGHTKGHLCYYITNKMKTGANVNTPPFIFTGDTLFLGGCGKLTQGSATQMASSLLLLSRLPAHTLVYPGHEYTRSNLIFARGVEPDNNFIHEKLRAIEGKACTVPGTIGDELQTNVFIRAANKTSLPSLGLNVSCLDITNPNEFVRLLREAKNKFKPTPQQMVVNTNNFDGFAEASDGNDDPGAAAMAAAASGNVPMETEI